MYGKEIRVEADRDPALAPANTAGLRREPGDRGEHIDGGALDETLNSVSPCGRQSGGFSATTPASEEHTRRAPSWCIRARNARAAATCGFSGVPVGSRPAVTPT